MIKTLLPLILIAGWACQPQGGKSVAELSSAELTEAPAGLASFQDQKEPESYGTKIHAGEAMAVAEAVKLLDQQDSVLVKIEGSALSSCQMKGCWMMVDLPGEQNMRVTFKDYGFFVPKDLNGERVIMEGVLKKKVNSVDELRHFAEDAGKSAEEVALITEPETTATFVAEGVLIYRD